MNRPHAHHTMARGRYAAWTYRT